MSASTGIAKQDSLCNLLSLRKGGQVEPAWLPDHDEVLEEDDWDVDTASVDTRNAH